jgi:hypothetical protein
LLEVEGVKVIAQQKGGMPEIKEGKRVVESNIRVPPPHFPPLSFTETGYLLLYNSTG